MMVAAGGFLAHHPRMIPLTHLLSNGDYAVMLTTSGSGYSRWRDTSITRWREDPVRDPWGSYVFLRDVASGRLWSAGYLPTGREPDAYEVAFEEGHARFERRDGALITSMEVLVVPDVDAEVRRVSVTNTGKGFHEIELTTYSEVVLSPADADSAHPAFSKMFVQTEFVAAAGALLAVRRNREPAEQRLWAAHLSVLEGNAVGGLQYESDRARFLGRGNDLRNAAAIVGAHPLSNTVGTVLDPVLSLRRRVRIAPGETAHVAFWTFLAHSRAEALSLADRHREASAFEQAKTLATERAQRQLRDLGVDATEARHFQRIANAVLYSDPALRAAPEILTRNRLGQANLWPLGISGDLPLVLLRLDDGAHIEFLDQLLRARDYWRLKRLAVDLVFLNDRPEAQAAELESAIDAAIKAAAARGPDAADYRGRVFSLRAGRMTAADIELLLTAARAVFLARRGSLGDELERLVGLSPRTPSSPPIPPPPAPTPPAATRGEAPRAQPALEFFNGLGGFAAGGREYVTVLDEGQHTPAPWINVVANAEFGFQASTDGAGTTWALNARENQLTPWSNDPVVDPPSEAIYLRDESSGELWSATPLPIRRPTASYRVHHGFGYSRFEQVTNGIALELTMFVPLHDTVKISRLKVANRSTDVRNLRITHYVDWVLGNQRSRTAPFIITNVEPKTSALCARNPWRVDFPSRVAFIDMLGRQETCSGDRAEVLGRYGSMVEPESLLRGGTLSNRVGGGLDSCGALQAPCKLKPGEETEFVFLLGDAASEDAAAALVERYRLTDLDAVVAEVTEYWNQTLGVVQVKTPDRSMDILLNGWLLYQTLACRVWARTGFYQTSGAYGFRDQLQDVMALCTSRPELTRAHILRSAARQFLAGDVQHWWLPTSGQGIKTRISDNRIWLPFVVWHYLQVTGDTAVLDEEVPFLEGPPLTSDQHEIFAAPAATTEKASLYRHCVLALDSSLSIGSHGLPLFGAGDWNDGMNRVGAAGRGESVWLGWFLYDALMKFAGVAEGRGDTATANTWRKHAFALQQGIEREAWDGDWYRRGYFDDGTPLGSVAGDECRIDAIAQSWAVISAAGDADRATRAMSAVNAQLVSRSDGLVKLFTPPFDRTTHDPGYIKAYPPGLRENGGQYSHAAMWTTWAFALLGDGDRAGELFSVLNPINHATTLTGIHRYKVEPYVVCADVYAAEGHVGRGGWTWYTGSAGWMYRTGVEGILGIALRNGKLTVDPCIPRAWNGFEITVQHGASRYRIAIDNPHGVSRGIVRAHLDERPLSTKPCVIELVDDNTFHYVRVTLG